MEQPQVDADTAPRQIVVCCDGTNNTLTGGTQDTNVLLLAEHLSRRPAAERLLLYYDPGVGSPDALPSTGFSDLAARRVERIVGLALGRGIYENIGEAYLFLCRNFRAHDQVFLFGFSRGAFTVRSVAGMVNMFGLLAPQHETLLPTLLRVYFAADERHLHGTQRLIHGVRSGLRGERPAPSRRQIAQQLQDHFTSAHGRQARIHFIGVWDTVESVGMPGLRKAISNKSSIAGKRFDHVRHALSLDEHRHAFQPRYYDGDPDPDPGQTLKQVWFRGVHSDVGGGNFAGQSGLSREALAWMVDEAHACGLRCEPWSQWRVPQPLPERTLNDQLHATPWWAVAGMSLRRPAQVPGGNVDGASMAAPLEHPSVAQQAQPASLWAQWRSWPVLALCLLAALALLAASGVQMLPSRPADGMAYLVDGWRSALSMAAQQLCALLGPEAAWDRLTAPGLRPRRALGWDFAFLGCAAYLLARLTSRAFAWLARWRRVGDGTPWWARLQLGRALPWLLLADVAENLLGLLAFTLPRDWGVGVLWLASWASLCKALGLLGVALLVAAGWRGRARQGG